MINIFQVFHKGSLFSMYAKFSKKLIFLTPWYAHVRTCVYQGERNVCFSENLAYILNELSFLTCILHDYLLLGCERSEAECDRSLWFCICRCSLNSLSLKTKQGNVSLFNGDRAHGKRIKLFPSSEVVEIFEKGSSRFVKQSMTEEFQGYQCRIQ